MRPAVMAFALLFALDVQAQREPKGDDYEDGYRAGFRAGFREGVAEGEKRGATLVVPPPPAKPGPTGPITVSNAYYGTDSKNCNATHWLARRVNGKRSASVDVENNICGDPAPGKRKSLEVTYICGSLVKNASANEHRTLYLDCNS